MAVDISKAESIQGWMQIPELTWLAEQAQQATSIVEVGSHVGRSTRALADNTQGRIIAVDDWFGPRDTIIPHSQRLKLYQQFGDNLMDSATALDRRLVAWKVDHAGLYPEKIKAALGEDFRADFIFIDGIHEYLNVLHDVRTWLPFVSDGGLISGHDFTAQYPGVLQAVLELVPLAQPVPNTSIWQYRKPLP